jgi:hypothetical protein
MVTSRLFVHSVNWGLISTPPTKMATLLCEAAENGHAEAIRAFHELGADIDAADQDGRTPLHAAAVKLLRKLGANMNAKSAEYGTPVDVAREMGRNAVAEKLVRYTSQCALPKESHSGCQAVYLQPMQEDVLLLCAVPEAGLEAAQAEVFGQL